jgi:GT2 family glycosyltransferase
MELTANEPLVAAVVISRNEDRWIESTLRAVLAAVGPFPDSEVVLVDSCSADRTVARAHRFPIRVVELRPDAPLSPALGRLVGQHLTRSRYVLFVDGDTEIEATWVQAAVEYLEQNPRIAGVGGKLPEVYYDDGRVVGGTADFFATGELPEEVDELGGNAVYRRATLEQVGSFNPFIASYEESELTERLRHAGHPVVRLPVVLGTHHTGPRGSLRELSRRYRDNLIKGYGQTLRVAIHQGTFGAHARRMKRYLQFQACLAAGLLALGVGLLLRDWRAAAGWTAGAAGAVTLFVVRSRSLSKPLRMLADWTVWTGPMVRGFLERPRDPRRLEATSFVARTRDLRTVMEIGSGTGARHA